MRFLLIDLRFVIFMLNCLYCFKYGGVVKRLSFLLWEQAFRVRISALRRSFQLNVQMHVMHLWPEGMRSGAQKFLSDGEKNFEGEILGTPTKTNF